VFNLSKSIYALSWLANHSSYLALTVNYHGARHSTLQTYAQLSAVKQPVYSSSFAVAGLSKCYVRAHRFQLQWAFVSDVIYCLFGAISPLVVHVDSWRAFAVRIFALSEKRRAL